MKQKHLLIIIFLMTIAFSARSQGELSRVEYHSSVDDKDRDFFLYLPVGYDANDDKEWPVLMFLHGNGERGDGKEDLDFVKIHGPLYEAWVQKHDLPFVMIVPQLHLFGMDTVGIPYLTNRDVTTVPKRLAEGVPPPPVKGTTNGEMDGAVPFEDMASRSPILPNGWDLCEDDLMGIVETVLKDYNTDAKRVYLSGLSYGGFGTWFLASKHPETFAAIAPVVGWGHPDLIDPIGEAQIPVWAFAGGRDPVVPVQFFFEGLNKLEKMGNENVRFTIHEDMGHDTWKRVYGGDDLYNWLLKFSK